MSFPGGRRGWSAAVAAAVLAAACAGSGGVPGTGSTATTGLSSTTTSTTVPPPVLCAATEYLPPATQAEVRLLPAADAAAATLRFSADRFACAAAVVVAGAGDLESVALAAGLAAALQGPLLFSGAGASPALDAELARLLPQRIWVIGDDVATPAIPAGAEVRRLDGEPAVLAATLGEMVGGTPLALPAGDPPGLVAVAVQAMAGGLPLEPAPTTTTTTTAVTTTAAPTTSGGTSAPTTTAAPDEPPAGERAFSAVLAGSGEAGVAWLVDAGSPALALAAAATAIQSGGLMALVDGEDLRRFPEVGRALRAAAGGVPAVRLVGEVTSGAAWQLPLLLEGEELPGGGYLLFPGRRLVALYGHAWAPSLGVLGEQSPEESVDLARQHAAPYAEEGLVLVPAFEIIATVAAATAGSDGNFSNETAVEDLRPWVEAAGAAGLYVLLDLQPGRSDFLSQARLYEEFLRLPYVGLALDPEWRLGPDQLPLQQFGTVPASEVNQVAEWLAGLVREERLPQKLLLLHQFRLSMIPDRENITIPPELAMVIQMDGQGPLGAKYNTWENVTAGTEEAGWFWGWKNFYDEDSPMATPEQVRALEPAVVYVSYQ